MGPRDEDELWQDIVDNYGETPDGAALDAVQQPLAAEPDPAEPAPAWQPVEWEDEGRYVPPPPPAVGWTSDPPRLLAWLGLVLAPVILLVATVAAVRLPTWAMTLLLAAFLGGFGYLVVTMNREPRDPYDDGAVL